MSLRNPHDPHDLRDKSFDNLAAYVAKGHKLKQLGRFWSCACGKVYSWAKSRRDGELCQAMHQKAVVESIENTRNGNSNYDDE